MACPCLGRVARSTFPPLHLAAWSTGQEGGQFATNHLNGGCHSIPISLTTLTLSMIDVSVLALLYRRAGNERRHKRTLRQEVVE